MVVKLACVCVCVCVCVCIVFHTHTHGSGFVHHGTDWLSDCILYRPDTVPGARQPALSKHWRHIAGRNHVLKVVGPIPRSRLLVQNKIRMVYPVSCTAVCYLITLFIKKVGWSVQFFFFWGGGVRTPPNPPAVAPLADRARLMLRWTHLGWEQCVAGNRHV